MNKSLRYCPYQKGDELNMLQLFQLSYGRPMTMDYWLWRFRDNPYGQVMIEMCWDGEILVAAYTLSPVMFSIEGEDHLGAIAMSAMTHPDYRGRGVITTTGNQLCERAGELGYKLVLGFTNRHESHYAHIRNLDFHDIHEIPMLRLGLNNLPQIPKMPENVTEYTEFNDQFDDLWKKVKKDHPFIKIRNQTYLGWRFGKNPENKYRIFGYVQDDMLLGYVVIKSYQSEIDIVDILSVQDNKIGQSLITAVIAACHSTGTTGINVWLPFHNPLHIVLEKMGFKNKEPITNLFVRVLPSFRDDTKVFHARNWYYTMADVDIF